MKKNLKLLILLGVLITVLILLFANKHVNSEKVYYRIKNNFNRLTDTTNHINQLDTINEQDNLKIKNTIVAHINKKEIFDFNELKKNISYAEYKDFKNIISILGAPDRKYSASDGVSYIYFFKVKNKEDIGHLLIFYNDRKEFIDNIEFHYPVINDRIYINRVQYICSPTK
jgi:uncharacterized protein YxeA